MKSIVFFAVVVVLVVIALLYVALPALVWWAASLITANPIFTVGAVAFYFVLMLWGSDLRERLLDRRSSS